jgi:phosphate transport system substrate-binding protein
MKTPAHRCSAVVATVLATLFGSATTASRAQDAGSQGPVSLRGAGSTFSAPLYQRWIEEYAASHPQVSISYDVVGSGEGIKRFLTDAVDFAGSDEILNDSDAAKAGGAIMVPVTAGMIVLAYNIPGVAGELRLPRDVYLDMFAGGIRQWDDPRIKAANPGVALPHHDIVLVARQDGSGTTAAFPVISTRWVRPGAARVWASAS